ncbi:MAG TPA: hypothetical protein PKD64_14650 [Pirellulaceae bacterium]|nr:hypothetical protein [Pirellulaceae bacterium]
MYRRFIVRLSGALVIASVLVAPGTTTAQEPHRNLTPAEQDSVLIRTTIERDFSELVEAISTRDNGNYDLVALYGKVGSSPGENFSVIRALTADPRVRKLYQQLDAMPEHEAASRVAEVFQGKFQDLKRATAAGERVDMAQNYGPHAAVFFSFEFAGRSQFNKSFREWKQRYGQQIAAGAYRQVSPNAPADRARISFDYTRRPELLMYLDLVLIDQVRQGIAVDESSEFGRMLKDYGWVDSISESYGMHQIRRFDAGEDAEPLAELPLFVGWRGLDITRSDQRIRIMSRAQNFLDPPGPMELVWQRLVEQLVDAADNAQDVLNELARRAKPLESGARLQFVGPKFLLPLEQRWPANRTPKQHMLYTIDRLYRQVPDSDKPNFTELVEQARQWVREVPESGIETEELKVFQWPEVKEGPDGERDTEPKYLIRLELIKTTILDGKLPDEHQGEQGSSDGTDRR